MRKMRYPCIKIILVVILISIILTVSGCSKTEYRGIILDKQERIYTQLVPVYNGTTYSLIPVVQHKYKFIMSYENKEIDIYVSSDDYTIYSIGYEYTFYK